MHIILAYMHVSLDPSGHVHIYIYIYIYGVSDGVSTLIGEIEIQEKYEL
jgi:hypothetical protein